MQEQIKIPKLYIDLLDQLFEVDRKTEAIQEPNSVSRNINKMKEIFENIFSTGAETEVGLTYHNPLGEPYSDTRTDLEASIAGDSAENLFIIEVIKPIIRYRRGGTNLIARKGVVVVESKKSPHKSNI
jgi:hypothetical protein